MVIQQKKVLRQKQLLWFCCREGPAKSIDSCRPARASSWHKRFRSIFVIFQSSEDLSFDGGTLTVREGLACGWIRKSWTKLTNVAETYNEPEMKESPGLTAFIFSKSLEKDGTWINEKFMRKWCDYINAHYALYTYHQMALERDRSSGHMKGPDEYEKMDWILKRWIANGEASEGCKATLFLLIASACRIEGCHLRSWWCGSWYDAIKTPAGGDQLPSS